MFLNIVVVAAVLLVLYSTYAVIRPLLYMPVIYRKVGINDKEVMRDKKSDYYYTAMTINQRQCISKAKEVVSKFSESTYKSIIEEDSTVMDDTIYLSNFIRDIKGLLTIISTNTVTGHPNNETEVMLILELIYKETGLNIIETIPVETRHSFNLGNRLVNLYFADEFTNHLLIK